MCFCGELGQGQGAEFEWEGFEGGRVGGEGCCAVEGGGGGGVGGLFGWVG